MPWNQVIDAALELRGLLEQFELVSFIKNTCGKGLHVVVPIARRHDWETVKTAVAPWRRPLSWRELTELAGPVTVTVQNVSEFLAKRRDPWRELPQVEQRLSSQILKLLKVV